MVEFHRTDSSVQKWVPSLWSTSAENPKRISPTRFNAQAICLEEMLNTDILSGALFYGKTRRRLEVTFDEELRHKTMETAAQLHAMIESGITPPEVC